MAIHSNFDSNVKTDDAKHPIFLERAGKTLQADPKMASESKGRRLGRAFMVVGDGRS